MQLDTREGETEKRQFSKCTWAEGKVKLRANA